MIQEFLSLFFLWEYFRISLFGVIKKCVQFTLCSCCPGTMLSLCLVIFVGRCSSSVPVMLVCFGRWRHFILAGFSSLTCMCNVLWTASVLDWQNPFPHSWHLKGFSFEWMYLEGRTDKRRNVIWQHNNISSGAHRATDMLVPKALSIKATSVKHIYKHIHILIVGNKKKLNGCIIFTNSKWKKKVKDCSECEHIVSTYVI